MLVPSERSSASLIQIEACKAKVPALGRGTKTGSHDDHGQIAKVPSLAQGGMPEIVSLWRDEELLLGLNDLLLDRNGCGGPHFHKLI